MHINDASQRSELNTTMRDAMWRGHGGWEIAAVPALFGLGGWFVDGWLGTTPIVTVVAVVLGLFGAVLNQYVRYTEKMSSLEAERLATRAAVESGRPRFGKTEASA